MVHIVVAQVYLQGENFVTQLRVDVVVKGWSSDHIGVLAQARLSYNPGIWEKITVWINDTLLVVLIKFSALRKKSR